MTMSANIIRGDWVRCRAMPQFVGTAKRVSLKHKWADVNWGCWVKRMRLIALEPTATITWPDGTEITDMNREKELAEVKP